MMVWDEAQLEEDFLVRVLASARGIRELQINPAIAAEGSRDTSHPLIAEALAQLRAYLAGNLIEFRLPLDAQGTPFQQRVWRTLDTIPYGETRSYRWLAETVGCPRGFQAVGQANGANPIGIVVPCHRVIASGGGLGGYAGGLRIKRRLLDLESQGSRHG